MMTIRSAKFVLSLDRLRAFPGQGMPEIAMAGKSNVGKSSMINSLLGNSKLARTSSEPGKTRLINFFQVQRAILAGRSARLWLCQGAQGRARQVGRDDRRLS